MTQYKVIIKPDNAFCAYGFYESDTGLATNIRIKKDWKR